MFQRVQSLLLCVAPFADGGGVASGLVEDARQPVQLNDSRVYLHASTIHGRSAAANLARKDGQVLGSQVRAQPHVAHSMKGLSGLGCGVGGYLDHDCRVHLD